MARKPAKKSRKRTTSKARKPHAKPSPEYKVTGPYSPEQRAVIVERMKAVHSPATIQGTIQRPDFHVTTDIRATSDPLWRHLAAFRRRLMEGGTFTPAEWQSMLVEIRDEAHAAGLRPRLGNVEYIVATLSEAREGDPHGGWEDEPDNHLIVILTACGEAGWIQHHELLDGFSAGRGGYSADSLRSLAIEWAESWMNARERQLAEPGAMTQLKAGIAAIAQLMTANAERAETTARVFRGGDNGDVNPPAGGQASGSPDQSGPVPKPDGWTKGDLRAQAAVSIGGLSDSTFTKMLKAAGFESAERGGKGAQRRFSKADVRKIIKAVKAGRWRNSDKIAKSLEELLTADQK
jgi:hypothetical protein